MNIFDNSIRKIICIRNDNDTWGCSGNGSLLTVGKQYTLVDTNVHGWYTEIELAEFPGKQFNSVLFEEVDENV